MSTQDDSLLGAVPTEPGTEADFDPTHQLGWLDNRRTVTRESVIATNSGAAVQLAGFDGRRIGYEVTASATAVIADSATATGGITVGPTLPPERRTARIEGTAAQQPLFVLAGGAASVYVREILLDEIPLQKPGPHRFNPLRD